MRGYKKKTLALVLASVVTVVGSFASGNYKNSLTGLEFKSSESGAINLVVQTKVAYSGNITPTKTNLNTYVLTLPDVNSEASSPDLSNVSGNIQSVNIRTMPYSNNAKGYTRITIKTFGNDTKISATNQVFLPNKNINQYSKTAYDSGNNVSLENRRKIDIKRPKPSEVNKQRTVNENGYSEDTPNNVSVKNELKNEYKPIRVTPQSENIASENELNKSDTSNNYNTVYTLLLSLIVVLGCAFFYIRAREKMRDIAGDDITLDDTDFIKNFKYKDLKKTVNKLDLTYSNSVNKPLKQTPAVNANSSFKKAAEDLNVVDLDELFKEQNTKQKMTEEEENKALEEFLSGFSFEEEIVLDMTEVEKLDIGYDNLFYEKLLSSTDIKFSNADVACINKLLGYEIQDETLENISKYAVSKPFDRKLSKHKILENLVSTYAISQNIVFNNEDVKILEKLVSVELDADFITDLRTNSEKTKKMEQDILSYGDKPKKPSEIVTLCVKEKLPDLSKELELHGDKKILSNYKPDVVYFSKGYEFKTLEVGSDMPDLALEIYKNDLFKYKPSAKFELLDESYSIGTKKLKLSESNSLDNKPENIASAVVDGENEKENLVNHGTNNDLIHKQERLQNNLKKIELTKDEREKRKSRIAELDNFKTRINIDETNLSPSFTKCVIDGENLDIVSSVMLSNNIECYLAKNERGYIVLGYNGSKFFKLKRYEMLKSEKIQARKSEQLVDGYRYIVRIGVNKFVVDLKEDSLKYVMDLC